MIFNNQIKSGLLLSLPVKTFLKSVNIWRSNAQKDELCRALSSHCGGQAHKVHDTTTFLPVTLPDIHRLKKFTGRLSNKPFLI